MLYNVIGIDDLEGTTFGRFTTSKKAEMAKEMLEKEGFENVLDIQEDNLPVDVIMIDGKMIKL